MNFLYENEKIPEKLEEFIKDNSSLQSFFKIDFDGIRLDNYCGFLGVDDEDYFIVPKIANNKKKNLKIFIYMLMFAYDIKLSNVHLANFESFKYRFLEIFIRYFSNRLFQEFKKGVYKKYVLASENLKVLRGKYLFDKNFTNFYHQNIYCDYDEFSMDNELNQFFLYAVKLFQKYSNYKGLKQCEMILDEVEFLHQNINRMHINFDRMSARFKSVYELAIVILNRLIPLPSKSKRQNFAFLFDMGEVFEKFIGKIYKSIYSSAQLQIEKNFGNLKLKPDIKTDNLIIDTKYKKISGIEDLKKDDKYQMFVYGINFEIQDAILLYPKFIRDINEDLELGCGDKMVRLKLRTIDLDSDRDFEEYIEEIRKRLEEI